MHYVLYLSNYICIIVLNARKNKRTSIKICVMLILLCVMTHSTLVVQSQRCHVVQWDSPLLHKNMHFGGLFFRHVWKGVQRVASTSNFNDYTKSCINFSCVEVETCGWEMICRRQTYIDTGLWRHKSSQKCHIKNLEAV